MNQASGDTNSALNMRKGALTALAGTSIEWYDFFLYGAAAALIFPTAFFGEVNPSTALILSLLTFLLGIGFSALTILLAFHQAVSSCKLGVEIFPGLLLDI